MLATCIQFQLCFSRFVILYMSRLSHYLQPNNILLASLFAIDDFLLVFYDHSELIVYWGLDSLKDLSEAAYSEPQYQW